MKRQKFYLEIVKERHSNNLIVRPQTKSARTCITSPPYYGLRDYGWRIENQIGGQYYRT